TYSTGMVARLGFAVATDVDPDVLIVDEALSVGDERFRSKCDERMGGYRKAGKTVVIVSHALTHIRKTCERVAWLDHGRLVADGDVEPVTTAYRKWSEAPLSDALEYCRALGLAPEG